MRLTLSLLILGLCGPVLADDRVPHPEKLRAVGPALQKFVDDGELAGAVCVVGRKDGVVLETAVGYRDLAARDPMTPATLFRIASMTKPVTAVGIMILADEGKLDPADDVARYLPEFGGQLLVAVRDGDTVTLKKPARSVRLRDLLTHTGGLAPYPPGLGDVYGRRHRTLAETTLAAALLPLQFEPGSRWAYSNPGIDVLGRVIEVVSGERYEDFLRKRVFDPLGMTDTTFYPTKEQLARLARTYGKGKDGRLVDAGFGLVGLPADARHPVPAAGLISTGRDLARLYRMMLHGGTLDGKRVLSERAVAEMTRLHTGDLPTGFVEGMGFGYGWAVVREPKGVTGMFAPGTFGHGGAFGTQGWIDPKQDVFVILLIQRAGLPNADASPMRQVVQELAVAAVKP